MIRAGSTDTQSSTTPHSITPSASYNLLLAFQSTSISQPRAQPTDVDSPLGLQGYDINPYTSTENTHQEHEPEWHELVDSGVLEILDREEIRRQGLWWELIKGEREYVRDLRVVCEVCLKVHFVVITDHIGFHPTSQST
jgi:hypothetical protein